MTRVKVYYGLKLPAWTRYGKSIDKPKGYGRETEKMMVVYLTDRMAKELIERQKNSLTLFSLGEVMLELKRKANEVNGKARFIRAEKLKPADVWACNKYDSFGQGKEEDIDTWSKWLNTLDDMER